MKIKTFLNKIRQKVGSKSAHTKYQGFSLVELLVTIIIVMILLMLVATTLTSMIKTSLLTNSKNVVRQESEFILEVTKRNLKGADVENIRLYRAARRYFDGTNISDGTAGAKYITVSGSLAGNEIQIVPSNGEGLICIAFFKPSEGAPNGYILRTYAPSTYTINGAQVPSYQVPRGCFDPTINSSFNEYLQILNSFETHVIDFNIKVQPLEEGNSLFLLDLIMEPVRWVPGNQSSISKQIRRQTLVSTEKVSY